MVYGRWIMKRSNLLAIAASLGTAVFLLCGASFAPSVLASSKKATSISINAANFPNAAFREYVREFDLDGNGSFSEQEIKKITDIEICDNTAVTNLKGIEFFTYLETLDCSYDKISSLNLSNNISLRFLNCEYNNLSSLNLTYNPYLETLFCEGNNLSSLNVSSNPELCDLRLSGNPISALNLANNPILSTLDCSSTKISTLNIGANPDLTWLNCNECENLSSLNVTKNPMLEYLDAGCTKISSINVTKNSNLTYLGLYSTSISTLNVKNNSQLEELDCSGTTITSIDVSKNTALRYLEITETSISSINVSNCKNLECLYCGFTNISSLNISNNRKLKTLDIRDTNINTVDISAAPQLLTDYAGDVEDCGDQIIYSYYDKKADDYYYLYVNSTTTIRTVPGALSTLSAAPAGKNAVKLSWQFSGVADGYLIYGQKNGKYGYVGMTTTGKTFTDTKALSENYNYYWVFPYTKDAKGNMYVGSCTKYVFAKGICPAVTNLKATSVKGGVKLTWTASAGAEGYLIYGIVDGKPYKYIGMTSGTTFTDKTASSTQYNYYWVYPYFKNSNDKMIVGLTGNYTYGKALP